MVAEPNRKKSSETARLEALGGALKDASPLALDRVIHERLRLGIVSALAAASSMSFKELKEVLGATDGNLSAHARKLEQAGYIRCEKSFVERVPRTEYSLTELGKERLAAYLAHLEALIEATRNP